MAKRSGSVKAMPEKIFREAIMSLRGILFDKDGTLIDFAATFEPATRLVLESLCKGNQALMEDVAQTIGYDIKEQVIRTDSPIIAGSSADIAAMISGHLGVRDIPQLGEEIDRQYGEICVSTVQPIPGMVETVQTLADRGYLLGIATNDAQSNGLSQMQTLGVDIMFTSIFGADSGFGQKPGPGMVTAFVEQSAFAPSEVLMVGDSLHDMEAGNAAGAKTCAVLTGPAPKHVLEPHADVILQSIVELPDHLGTDN